MKVCVTGGRDFNDIEVVWTALDSLHVSNEISLLVHGACHYGGADLHAENWAKHNQIMYIGIPAQWKRYGKSAGMLRNQDMLDRTKPDLLVAFPGGTGTEGCKKEARKRGINVVEFS